MGFFPQPQWLPEPALSSLNRWKLVPSASCCVWHEGCKGENLSRMMRQIIQPRLFASALCVLALSAGVVQGAEGSSAAKEKAKKSVTTAADLKKLLDEAGKQRDALIADYETLRKELADATEERKQAIRQKMEERKKAFEEMTVALHKQIRDEQRKQRAATVATKPR